MLTSAQATTVAYEVEGEIYSIAGFKEAFPDAIEKAEAYRTERQVPEGGGYRLPSLYEAFVALGYRPLGRYQIHELAAAETEAKIEGTLQGVDVDHWPAEAKELFRGWLSEHASEFGWDVVVCAQTGKRIT